MARPTVTYPIKAEDQSTAVIRKIRGAFRGLGSQVAALAGIGGFGAMVKASLDSADKIQKLSIQLGTSTEFLSEMSHAAGLTGTSMSDLENGIRRMQKSIGDANDGLSTANRAFQSLGLTTEDLLALSPDEQFLAIADAISKIDNEALRTQVSMNLFGRAGGRLNQLFAGGAESINKMREEAQKLGLSLGRDQVDAAANANDAMLRLENAFKGVGVSMAIEFAEPLESVADFMRNTLVPAVGFVIDALQALGKAFGGVAAGAVAFLSGDFSESGAIFKSTFSDLFGSIGDSAVSRFERAQRDLSNPNATNKDPEQEKTREVIKGGNDILKEIARNTGRPQTAVAG